MVKHYLEIRHRPGANTAATISDLMRYVHARQGLGRTIVLCDQPDQFLPLAKRHWLRLSRALQRQRAAAETAEQILDYTRAITRLQQAEFIAGTPTERPDAAVYFVQPQELELLPVDLLTLAVAVPASALTLGKIIRQLPATALVVDYTDRLQVADHGLLPKAELDSHAAMAWRRVASFLNERHIDLAETDDALDVLLTIGPEFLPLAEIFAHTLELARPLRRAPKQTLEHYEAFMRLAGKVQALSPGATRSSLFDATLQDPFFFNDAPQVPAVWADLVAFHQAAGRHQLARALMAAASRTFKAKTLQFLAK